MEDRLEALRSRLFVVPIVIGLLVFCIFGTAMAPLFHAKAHDVPMAILSLDKGTELPTGETLNAGETMVETILEKADEAGNGEDSPIAWTQLSGKDELDQALEEGRFYGAVVVPEDFTEQRVEAQGAVASVLQSGLSDLAAAQQAAAAQAAAVQAAGAQAAAAVPADEQAAPDAAPAPAAGAQQLASAIAEAQAQADKPTVEVIVNQAKNPMIAQTMQQSLTTMLAQAGIEVDLRIIGDIDTGDNPLAAMMGIQMMVMPLIIMSLIMSLVAVLLRWPGGKASRNDRSKAAIFQVVYAAIASLIAATAAYGIVAIIGGLPMDAANVILFLWFASFCIMLANIGLCNLALPLGVLVMLCMFALGMATAVLAPEMMPQFWADSVIPWAPQFHIGEGLRNIVYLQGNGFDTGITALAAWGCAGLAALLLAVALPSREKEGAHSA